ncbi:MAG: lipid-A-disaccharide synthase [Pseudomonadota bacterium]
MTKTNLSIMMIASEASSEQRGAEVAVELYKQMPYLHIFGVGGQAMRDASVETVIDVRELSILGFFEVIQHLPKIVKIYRRVKTIIQLRKPDLIILIDGYGFNIKIAALAKKLGINVLFYISPQVWASRRYRIKKIVKYVDHIAVIFPFEKEYYSHKGIAVDYVGHPLTKKFQSPPTVFQARQQLDLPADIKIIALMPGSRRNEIDYLLPIMLESAVRLKARDQEIKFILPLASTISREKINHFLESYDVDINVIPNHSIDVAAAVDMAIVASGTATLELALLRKPMIILGKVHPLTAVLLRRLIKIPYVGLCNIIAGKKIVCEFLQQDATADNIVAEAIHILEDQAYRDQMIENLTTTKAALGNVDAANKVANIALDMIK